jgi:hypothetical protein
VVLDAHAARTTAEVEAKWEWVKWVFSRTRGNGRGYHWSGHRFAVPWSVKAAGQECSRQRQP